MGLPVRQLTQQVTEQVLGVGAADGAIASERQLFEPLQGSIVSEAILAASQLAGERMCIGMRRRAAGRLMPHVCDINPRTKPLVSLQEAAVLALPPLDRFLDNGK